MPINFLDMFAGIGGFRSGLERLGGFECVGYCEIDKYAKQAYDAMYPTEGELYFADARTIDPYTLPDIDLICGGFPCQSFSMKSIVAESDNRICRLLFKMAVQLAVTMNVVAANSEIDDVSLERLKGECVKEVKRLNGNFTFKDANDWQKG